MNDKIIRAIAADGGVKLSAVFATNAIKVAQKKHNLSYLTSVLLGRAMSTGLLLASSMKVSHARVTLKIQSDGPLGGLVVDAGRDGTVRGYVGNPSLELDLIKDNSGEYSFDLSSATGTGYLHVIRDEGTGQPFSSTVELVGGGIGEDIASYLLHSEQTQSAVFVGEKIHENGLICSGGLIAQILPNASGDTTLINTLEKKCIGIKSFSKKLLENKDTPEKIFDSIFPELNPKVIKLEDESNFVEFKCRCSRDRSTSALKLLGKKEVEKILEEDRRAELTCHFCNNIYVVEEEELKLIVKEFGGKV